MGLTDKAKHMAEKATGKVKEKAGELTDDKDLEREGRADQVEGDLKGAVEKVKDVFKH